MKTNRNAALSHPAGRRPGQRLATACALVLMLGLAGTPPDTPAATALAAAASASHAADLRAYLDSVRWYESALARLPFPGDRYNQEFFHAFAAATTRDQFYARAVPVLTRHVSPNDARTLGAITRKSPVPQADRQAALQALAKADRKAEPELEQVWQDLMDAFSRQNIDRAVAEIRRSVTDMVAHPEPGYLPKVNKLGLSYLDHMVSLTVRLYAGHRSASQSMASDCDETNIDAAMQPAALLAQGGFAAAHSAIDRCERALQRFDASNKAAFDAFLGEVESMRMADWSFVLKQMETSSAAYHERNLEAVRLYRQVLEGQRKLVNLVETRREHLGIEDGQLVFDSDEDVTRINAIIDGIDSHATALNDFLYQVRQDGVLRDIDLRDGVTAPTARPADEQVLRK